MPLVLNHVTTGLETLVVFPWLALWVREYSAFGQGGSSMMRMSALIVGTYLWRPDAILIPGLAMLPCFFHDRRRTVGTLAISGLLLGAFLVAFKLYYGTALPLAFYVKSYWSNTQGDGHVQIFWHEKIKNLTQFFYLYLPLILIAFRGRTKLGSTLLGAALTFCAYHALFTVETMGHYSRFYMPAVVPIVAAAMEGFESFRAGASPRFRFTFVAVWGLGYALLKVLDRRSHVYLYIPAGQEIPWVCAMGLWFAPLKLWPSCRPIAAMCVVLVANLLSLPIETLRPELDRAILRRQIAARPVFFGLSELAEIHPKHVYHTDMGAPGILLQDSVVTDLDGLLNEEMLLEHKTFSELCVRDRPDAIFVPRAELYPLLRKEIKESACIRDYVPSPDPRSRLVLRRDRFAAYQEAWRRARAPKH
jgi:hypothetical protein